MGFFMAPTYLGLLKHLAYAETENSREESCVGTKARLEA